MKYLDLVHTQARPDADAWYLVDHSELSLKQANRACYVRALVERGVYSEWQGELTAVWPISALFADAPEPAISAVARQYGQSIGALPEDRPSCDVPDRELQPIELKPGTVAHGIARQILMAMVELYPDAQIVEYRHGTLPNGNYQVRLYARPLQAHPITVATAATAAEAFSFAYRDIVHLLRAWSDGDKSRGLSNA